jgi:signal transduction histidine kinase
MSEPLNLRVVMGSCERRGVWTVPAHVEARVMWGNMELDLRDAVLGPETTIDAHVTMGNLEILVAPDVIVDVNVSSIASNVSTPRTVIPPRVDPSIAGTVIPPFVNDASSPYRDPSAPKPKRLRVVGKARFANCEVIPLARGETIHDHARRIRDDLRRQRHHFHHAHRHGMHQRENARQRHEERRRALRAEREIWMAHPDRSPWLPWWLQARMRRRIFSWLTIAFVLGVFAGVRFWPHHHWWHFLIAAIGLSFMSGVVAWRLTRPFFLVVHAARDIGDGKLDTRLPTNVRGEMKVLALAINDKAARIEQQMKDQRQLLAAVSHELRTPLGHMRVLIETAQANPKALEELDREVLTLDDLVGRLLAQSRLEFGNLDKRTIDLGELVSDLATTAGVEPEAIEADGDVRAAVDPTLVKRAIANLLDNAKTHGGGPIAVRVVRRGDLVAVEVDDAGPGVPADRRADSFRAFVPSTGGGLGLGLALVSRIATAHDGGAFITDRPGGGARVGFTVSSRPVSAPG